VSGQFACFNVSFFVFVCYVFAIFLSIMTSFASATAVEDIVRLTSMACCCHGMIFRDQHCAAVY